MKYVKTSFYDESYDYEISTDVDGPENVIISISNDNETEGCASINLNLETAVKFSKELRRKIAEAKSYIKKMENNG